MDRYGKRWTVEEMAAALDAYLDMLERQRSGIEVDRRSVITTLVEGALEGRTAEAVRRRFCNLGAIFAEHGWPQVRGFEQRSHVGVNQTKVILDLIKQRQIEF